MKNQKQINRFRKTILLLLLGLLCFSNKMLGQEDLTNLNTTISESNNNSPSYEAIEHLIDNNINTKYLTFNASSTVTLQFPESYVIKSYALTSGNDAPGRDPSTWTFEGLKTNGTWEVIDSKSNISFDSRRLRKSFNITNTISSYSKVRFRFNNTYGSILQISELEIFGELPVVNPSVDLTQPGGNITEFNNSSPTHESIGNLIDNNTNTKYLTFFPSTTVEYNFQDAHVFNGYSLTSGNDYPSRDPENWIVEASNDGINWDELNRQTSNSFSGRRMKKKFNFQNNTSYRKIRFKFNNTSGNIFQLSELEVFGDVDLGNPIADFASDKTSIYEGEIVRFINKSTSNATYEWTFEGGEPSISNLENPVITYNTKGVYSVTLKVSNSNGTDISTRSNFIEVKENGGGTNCEWGNDFLTPNIIFKDLDGVTVGSRVFHQVIPNPESYMQQRCLDVAKILYRKSSNAPKFRQLTFELKNEDFVAYKYGSGDAIGIAVSTQHLSKIYRQSGNNPITIKNEIDGILFHEVTHGYNNSPITGGSYDGSSPFWAFTEGIADAVRIHAGFHQTRNPNINDNRKWLGGYTTTGFFLHYVSQKYDKNFVYKFNKVAKTLGRQWSFENAFQSILGKGVEFMWNDYVNFIRNSGKLDYDGDYPWILDCSETGFKNEVQLLNKNVKFKVYPNPIINELNIISDKSQETKVVIRGMNGKVHLNKKLNLKKGETNKLSLDLQKGIYSIELNGKSALFIKK